MNTVEKAIAYEKTIKKLRKFYRDYDTVSCLIDVKEELANLFPELKESENEDERIRKELIKGISKTRPNTTFLDTSITREEAIDWLEKQGRREFINPDTLIQQRVDALADNSWKPDPIELEELRKALNYTDFNANTLKNLYQKLKKVKL